MNGHCLCHSAFLLEILPLLTRHFSARQLRCPAKFINAGGKAARDFFELLNKNFRRIDRSPSVEIIVGESDHRSSITAGSCPKQVGGSELLWSGVHHAYVKRKLLKRG